MVIGYVLVLASLTSAQTVRVLPAQLETSYWSTYLGSANQSIITTNTPENLPAMQFSITATGSSGYVIFQYQFVRPSDNTPTPVDLTPYDTFYFDVLASATRIGDWAMLVDNSGRVRYYALNLLAYKGWQQPIFFLNKFNHQDANFDLAHVQYVRFGQAGETIGDQITIGHPRFGRDVVNSGILASSWWLDVGTGTLTTTTDSAVGTPSLLATINSDAGFAQVDIAMNTLFTQFNWDWTGKNTLTLFFKDSNADTGSQQHYFYYGTVCSTVTTYSNSSASACGADCQSCGANCIDVAKCHINGQYAGLCGGSTCRSYREYTFQNHYPGEWLQLTADLSAGSATGTVQLNDINWLEFGILQVPQNAQYTFELGPVLVH